MLLTAIAVRMTQVAAPLSELPPPSGLLKGDSLSPKGAGVGLFELSKPGQSTFDSGKLQLHLCSSKSIFCSSQGNRRGNKCGEENTWLTQQQQQAKHA